VETIAQDLTPLGKMQNNEAQPDADSDAETAASDGKYS
jgi:hypothetical protein